MSRQTYYGFADYGSSSDIDKVVLNITTKHGIRRGYDSDCDRSPYITVVYYYVDAKQTIIVDSDIEFHARYAEVDPKLKTLLEKIRKKCSRFGRFGHEVSDLGMMSNVGAEAPLSTKHQCVEVKYETDDDCRSVLTSDESDCGSISEDDDDSDDSAATATTVDALII